MLPADAELYRRVEEIVHYIWDPIGVAGCPHARDEYYSYMTAIFGRVQAGDLEEIIVYLKWAASENMGLTFDKERASEAAEAMLAWKTFINEST
ncbi:Uncharacterised protein [Halioglobus japonicus]|nr:Uncharacterised protein [Halioglobus japonicus]